MNNKLKSKIVANFKNTELGFVRVKRNLELNNYSNLQIKNHEKKILLSTPIESIETIGKNHYFKNTKYNSVLTVNSHSLTIITAKMVNYK